MIDSVDGMCRVWGAQKRRMMIDDGQGWSGQSVIVKFKEMRDGAGSSTQRVTQFSEEGIVGEGLLVSRAIVDAPEVLRLVLFAHYVVTRMRAKAKADALGLSIADYWRYLDRAHYWIAARVPRDDAA